MNKIKRLDKQLEKERQKAQKLYDKKQNTVVCEYCGNLLLKNEAGCIYDIVKKEMTYHHEKCFNKYEKCGTLTDLIEKERIKI